MLINGSVNLENTNVCITKTNAIVKNAEENRSDQNQMFR